jgi:small subunit ribosomal protein S2
VDTNSNPNLIDFPVPANDDASKSIHVIVKAICDAIAEGTEERKLDKEAQGEDANDDMLDVDVAIDEEEEQPAADMTGVKGVKKIKDVVSEEESTTKRKRIPTKKAPVKAPAKAPAKK